jgi:hypothetical protein
VLTTKFDIIEKLECPVSQTEISDFYSYKMVNICKWMSTLYISQVGSYIHVFRLCTCFSDNLIKFHSINKEVFQTTRI